MVERESKKRWDKEHFFMVGLKLHRTYDADIIAFLEQHPNEKQKYIRLAMREYMNKA